MEDVLSILGKAVYFFLPVYAGNATPVILNRLGWFERWRRPIDGGRTLRDGQPLFGQTKTWRGLVGGAIAGLLVGGTQGILYELAPALQNWYLLPYNVLFGAFLGMLLGLGEGLGDLFKSFIKRRLGIKSSGPFFPFDQLSFLGAILLIMPLYIPSSIYLITIITFSVFPPIIANIIAYKLGWKEVWW